MTRVHKIVFNNLSLVENVPGYILAAVPDVNDIHFKSDCFVNPIPQPETIDHVFQIDEALKAEGKEPTTLQDKVEKCFPVGSVWKRSEFETSLYQISSKYKFAWRCDSNRYFQCLKSGEKRSTSDKKKEDIQSSKNECPWKICVTNLWTFPKRSKGGRRATWSANNPSDNEKNNMFIVIKKIPTEEHNHPLDIETYQQTVQKCGVLGRALNADSFAVRNCLLFRQRKGYLSNEVIQAYFEESTPNFVSWNSEKCNNFKKKIERLYTNMTPHEYDTQNIFEANFKSKKIQEMFNDDLGDAVYTDKVSQLALARRLKFFIDSIDELSPNTQKSKIHAWFEQLRTIDPYFDYEMMKNENGKIIGMVWMTGQMRRDLEEYGGYIMLDFMKKEKNINLFPYASIVMFRPSGQLCLGSEALFFTESTATYKFLCDATFRMAYQRTKESVLVIASDEFLDQNRVTNELGFTNARLILDQFHLVVVNLAKKLSASGAFEKLQNAIYEWINASSETLFDQAFESLKYQMKGLHCTSSQESAVRELFDKRDYFAAYKLRTYKGTLRRKGNSGSESNHASVAQHLDSKNLLEIPQMQAMLVQRQKRWNYEMMRKFQKEELQLIRLNSSAENSMLKKASSCVDGKSLCLTGYKLFREQFQISLELEVIEVDSNGSTKFDDGITCKNGEECSCEYRQADLIQCCHEIKLSQSFDIGAFDRRYHYHIRPWDRRIKRNNYNSDDFQDNADHHVIPNKNT